MKGSRTRCARCGCGLVLCQLVEDNWLCGVCRVEIALEESEAQPA